MIPYRDESSTRLFPFVNWLLIAANLVVWFQVQGAGNPEVVRATVEAFGVRACEVALQCPPEGAGHLGLFSSMFLHGSWAHLLGNLLFLWVFGNNIEDALGHVRYLAFYVLAGLGASAAQVAVDPQTAVPMVGASGAIAGVMGGYFLLHPGSRIHTWIPPIFFVRLPALVILGYWIFVQVYLGMVTLDAPGAGEGGVAFWAHVGGFGVGLVTVKLFQKRGPSGTGHRRSGPGAGAGTFRGSGARPR